jgi:hypothetical protein
MVVVAKIRITTSLGLNLQPVNQDIHALLGVWLIKELKAFLRRLVHAPVDSAQRFA